jgi:uncharacterized protein DUF6065
MLLANQHGWAILNPGNVEVSWDGSASTDGLTITDENSDANMAVSHFGHGILTWRLPFLFRTPVDTDLLMRGPANSPKDGVAPLEGMIETDWSPATATMNWQVTRPHHVVRFVADEPIAMIVPVPRGQIERYSARLEHLNDDPELQRSYGAWRLNREQFLEELVPRERRRDEWQADYFAGRIGGDRALGHEHHRTRLHLAAFEGDSNGWKT